MSKLLANLRQKALEATYHDYKKDRTWKAAFLESIFRPKYPSVPGKGPMDMLHPEIDKLHLPEGCYIADWRKYQVEDHPALVNFQKRCHASGLHDPWLRNHCFAFYENVGGGEKSRTAVVTNGFSYGLIFAVICYGLENIYYHYFPATYTHSEEYIEKYGPGERPRHH